MHVIGQACCGCAAGESCGFPPFRKEREMGHAAKDAVHCYYDETMESPKIIRLHYARDEVLL